LGGEGLDEIHARGVPHVAAGCKRPGRLGAPRGRPRSPRGRRPQRPGAARAAHR
jgi:hypothetical protein